MKILILAVLSLGFLAQSNAQRRPGPGRPNPQPNPPAAADNVCNFSAREATLGGSGATAATMAECGELAFQAAHRYCEAARNNTAGGNVYNPINTSWTWNGQTDKHDNFECENVAFYPPKGGSGGGDPGGNGGRPGGGGGRPGGGGPGGGGGNNEPRVVETFEFTEAYVNEWSLPNDVCLVDHPRWGRDFRRNRDRFTIDRADAFCDHDEKWLRFKSCVYENQPASSYLPGTERWIGGSAGFSLSNKGQTVSVDVTSTEQVTEQYFYDAETERYNCSERDDRYRVRYVTYRVTRWSDGRRDRERVGSDTDWVQGIRLKRTPRWRAATRPVPTGDTDISTFVVESQAFEPQLDYRFSGTINHTVGSEPIFSFSDRYFGHDVSKGNVSNGGKVSIQSYITPIAPPSVNASMGKTVKTVPVLERLKINDLALLDLLKMSSNQMETTYTIEGILMHKKFWGKDKELGKFSVSVPNRENTPELNVDMEEVLRIAAQQTGNTNFNINRREKTYELKLRVSASRTNTKFVNGGASAPTQEIKAEIEKQ